MKFKVSLETMRVFWTLFLGTDGRPEHLLGGYPSSSFQRSWVLGRSQDFSFWIFFSLQSDLLLADRQDLRWPEIFLFCYCFTGCLVIRFTCNEFLRPVPVISLPARLFVGCCQAYLSRNSELPLRLHIDFCPEYNPCVWVSVCMCACVCPRTCV